MMKFIVSYWSQIFALITVIGGIITILVKIFFDWKTKKKEIKFSKLQENKILEIKSFYQSYLAVEISLREYHSQTMFGSPNEEDIYIRKLKNKELLSDFEYHCMVIKLFLDENEIVTIDQILEILDSIRRDIDVFNINKTASQNYIGEALIDISSERFPKKLPELLKKIEKSIRESFH